VRRQSFLQAEENSYKITVVGSLDPGLPPVLRRAEPLVDVRCIYLLFRPVLPPSRPSRRALAACTSWTSRRWTLGRIGLNVGDACPTAGLRQVLVRFNQANCSPFGEIMEPIKSIGIA
jgi:hypothetical protein